MDELAAIMNAASGQRSDSANGKSAETASDEILVLDKRVTKFAHSTSSVKVHLEQVLSLHLVPHSQFTEHASVSLQDCKTP